MNCSEFFIMKHSPKVNYLCKIIFCMKFIFDHFYFTLNIKINFHPQKKLREYYFFFTKPMSSRNADAIAEIFNKYDTTKSGKINKEQLRHCVYDLNGRQLDDVELNHIFELMDGDNDGMIHLQDFTKVMEQFFRYC